MAITTSKLPPPLARFPLCTERVQEILDLSEKLLQPKQPRQTIWCSLDADLCTKPAATEAIGKGLFGGPDEDPSQSSLSITFDQSTNTPNIEGNEGEHLKPLLCSMFFEQFYFIISPTNQTRGELNFNYFLVISFTFGLFFSSSKTNNFFF
jgi:hypothetical protein